VNRAYWSALNSFHSLSDDLLSKIRMASDI
jgi:hypothetical protein